METAQKQKPIAPNRIPPGAIRLSAAFERVYRTLTPDWQGISDRCVQSDEYELSNKNEGGEPLPEDPYRIEFEAIKRAEVVFRNALTNNEIGAYIYDLATGTIVELDPKDWFKFGDRPGIWNDYTSPTDPTTPGPDCISEGVRQPVFLMRNPLLVWLKTFKRDVILDLHNPEVRYISRALNGGLILGHVVAYFLQFHIGGLEDDKQSKTTDSEISALLIKSKLKDRNYNVDRVTTRKAYDLAMRIARLTRSPENWKDLGVAVLPPDGEQPPDPQ